MKNGQDLSRIARSISILARLIQMYYDRRLADAGIGWGQMFPLQTIARNPGITPHKLAAMLKVDGAQVTKSVRRLTELGLVASAQNCADRRSRQLEVTDKALSVLEAVSSVHSTFLADAAAGLSPEEQEFLERTLKKMTANLAAEVNR